MKHPWIRSRLRLAMVVPALAASLHAADERPGGTERPPRETVLTLSPLFGWNRNEVVRPGPGGVTTRTTETAPEYGFFGMLRHRNLVLNNFTFFTDVNDTEVFGNLLFANLYGNRRFRVSWNAGAGHLYHTIKPPNTDITVTVPMLKAGLLINLPEWRMQLNPYVGYAWERIETPHATRHTDAYLYGITLGWRWRMLGATLQYYYQDRQDADDDYHTVRARVHGMVNAGWGAVVRFDYMEHATSDDTSVLLGPLFVF